MSTWALSNFRSVTSGWLLPIVEACCSARHRFGEMSRSLPDRVAGLYYAHGLLCSSHPVIVIPLAISVLLLCWWVIRIYGSIWEYSPIRITIYMIPQERGIGRRINNAAMYRSYPLVNLPMLGNAPKTIINDTVIPINDTETSVLYVQQVVLRIGVMPWTEDLTLMDAFRGPLYEVFNLLEIIQNYQHPETLVKLMKWLMRWLKIIYIIQSSHVYTNRVTICV